MLKFKLKNGLTVYKTTAIEICSIGGFGICDECGEHSNEGYLIPVLNRWMCSKCYEDWKSYCKHYPEDDRIEARNSEYYEKLIPFEESCYEL